MREVFKETTWADRVLVIAVVFFLLPFSYYYYWFSGDPRVQGNAVEIAVAGKIVKTLLLENNGRYHIAGTLGDSLIEIKNHRARFLESPCQGKQCIHMGWQTLSGAFAACLPNRMTLTIKGETSQWDALNF